MVIPIRPSVDVVFVVVSVVVTVVGVSELVVVEMV